MSGSVTMTSGRGGANNELRPPTLDDLLSDGRLRRLFSSEPHHCALQLWILQIKTEGSIENRVIYGRLLPYRYSNDSWSSSEDDDFRAFGRAQAQITKLNLYVKSIHCAELLRQLSLGRTIAEISEELKFGLSEKLMNRFGGAALDVIGLSYRPVAYLLNRDAHELHSPSSPHGGAGAFSASISLTDKQALFRLGEEYSVALTEKVIKHLNAHTGLDFGGVDIARFGDLELLVFPTLNDHEQTLLSVDWGDDPLTLIVRFNPIQVPNFKGFQFHLRVTNDSQVTYSNIDAAECDSDGVFQCKFELSEQLRACTDSTEIEIFGFIDDETRHGTLCCRWRATYLRELHFQSHAVGNKGGPIKFDWLEKTTRPATSARVTAALTINRGNLHTSSLVGGRKADPWVSARRDLVSLFERLHPAKSEGNFFQRWGQSDGEGRLQFVEWFKALLIKYKQHQIIIFDPYFEDAGLGLLLLSAAHEADYTVFTSLPKPRQSKECEEVLEEADRPAPDRINNLMASCEHNRYLMNRIKLRIYGLKDGRLHDRYILVMAPDGLPVAGFNLSNSFQKAAENYPLLITPIPRDTLLKVERYKSDLIQEAKAAQSKNGTENPSMKLLFETGEPLIAPLRYEPLRFLDKPQAGDVLSKWTGELSLLGLSGDALKKRMSELGFIQDNSLMLSETKGWRNCLNQNTDNFSMTWDVLGDVFANSHTGDAEFQELGSKPGFLELLVQFLDASFNRAYNEVTRELTVIDSQRFRDTFKSLLHSPYLPHHFFHQTKYTALTWAEYYAVRFLWWYAPDVLVAMAERQMANVPEEPQGADGMRLSILSQIVSEISLSLEFNINQLQRNSLSLSKNGLLQWLGLNAIEREIEKSKELSSSLELVASFSYREQIQMLGWLAHHAADNEEKVCLYRSLVSALHEALPAQISTEDLKRLVDSMRGHMQQLGWTEPWLFRDVLLPLLDKNRANIDDACDIWVHELVVSLGPERERISRLFEREIEGQTTNTAAFLFAHSSSEQQMASVRTLAALLRRWQRVLQQPLASTSDWTQWNDALVVSMWILAFTRWGQYYLSCRGMTNSELDELSCAAHGFAMIRPMNEWRSMGSGVRAGLAEFLDQAEELLASKDLSKSESV